MIELLCATFQNFLTRMVTRFHGHFDGLTFSYEIEDTVRRNKMGSMDKRCGLKKGFSIPSLLLGADIFHLFIVVIVKEQPHLCDIRLDGSFCITSYDQYLTEVGEPI